MLLEFPGIPLYLGIHKTVGKILAIYNIYQMTGVVK